MFNKEKYSENSKERLKKIIGKKFQTTTIFPLAEFEDKFGYLWGHGKSEEVLTSDELELREKWDKCRQSILNNGNQQRRNSMSEIDMYSVTWNRYNTVFLPQDQYLKVLEEQKNGNRR